MSITDNPDQPLRVAIIGAGPAGFYAADALLKQKNIAIEVDLFDRLPTPFGLVRNGVAPDHQKIKSVTKAYDRVAAKPNFRFFGYVEFGRDIDLATLKQHYHQIIFSTGAQTDKRLNLPGIDLRNSHPATEFVAWYNGHPDYKDYQFDLSQEHVTVIGVGNVAVDVARILCRSIDELAQTDIADYALEALSQSKVKTVTMIGRRGPAQAAFSTPELKELGHLEIADCIISPEEAQLHPLSQDILNRKPERERQRKIDLIQKTAERGATGKEKQLLIRFLWSPTELIDDGNGQVKALKMVKNDLALRDDDYLRSVQTDRSEEWPTGLVFRSIGYRGVPLDGVPFDDWYGTIPNELGRVLDAETKEKQIGLYTTGWIKRGPSGVIGTNKPDAVETVKAMLADVEAGKHLTPISEDGAAIAQLIAEKQSRAVSYADWKCIDEQEVAAGEKDGRPRVKFVTYEDLLAAAGK